MEEIDPDRKNNELITIEVHDYGLVKTSRKGKNRQNSEKIKFKMYTNLKKDY